MPSVKVWTTYVWSDDDRFFGHAAAEACAHFVNASYRFIELSGVRHWIPEELPADLVHETGQLAPAREPEVSRRQLEEVTS